MHAVNAIIIVIMITIMNTNVHMIYDCLSIWCIDKGAGDIQVRGWGDTIHAQIYKLSQI